VINAYLTDTVIRHIAGVLGEWSERGIGTTEEIKAHVVYKSKLIYTNTGEEVQSPIQVLIKRNQVINHRDRIQLDGESFTHPIINILKRRHLSVEFQEIYLEPGTGRTQ
jgi:hypothetical protein